MQVLFDSYFEQTNFKKTFLNNGKIYVWPDCWRVPRNILNFIVCDYGTEVMEENVNNFGRCVQAH